MWLTHLRTEDAGHDKDHRAVWELIDPLVVKTERYGTILVPKGFRTNYASVPRLPVFFLLAGDKAHKAATVHDFLYTTHRLLPAMADQGGQYAYLGTLSITRREADDLFLECLADEPLVAEGLAALMHKAVRWFGQSSWDDETNILQLPEIRALYA